MCVDAKGTEENDISNSTPPRIKISNVQQDNELNTNSMALDQLIYSPLRNTKTLITSFCKFAYENPAMAAITTTYFMLPIVAAYTNTEGSYWSPQYCCIQYPSTYVSPPFSNATNPCATAPAIVEYASGFPGFTSQDACTYDVQYGSLNHEYVPDIGKFNEPGCYTNHACTNLVSCGDGRGYYIWAFVNNNTYDIPRLANCVSHQ